MNRPRETTKTPTSTSIGNPPSTYLSIAGVLYICPWEGFGDSAVMRSDWIRAMESELLKGSKQPLNVIQSRVRAPVSLDQIPALRNGRNIRASSVARSTRSEGILMQIVGTAVKVPCASCTGHMGGVFAACTVVAGVRNGACANCVFAENPKRCNLASDHNSPVSPTSRSSEFCASTSNRVEDPINSEEPVVRYNLLDYRRLDKAKLIEIQQDLQQHEAIIDTELQRRAKVEQASNLPPTLTKEPNIALKRKRVNPKPKKDRTVLPPGAKQRRQ